ncbi:hypothetical protein AAD16_000715 [Salmonella enterica subsp. diarizonae]|nr:hypothetical protein [Salmonella enterica subsp. diarizonae]EDY0789012.1 hypothetical protein [Salmonella enterica subsp. diarizonae]
MRKIEKNDEYFYISRLLRVSAEEVAIAILGNKCESKDKKIIAEWHKQVGDLKRAIARNLQNNAKDGEIISSSKNYAAHYVFCAAYRFIKDDAPTKVKELAIDAIKKTTKEKGWEETLKKIGGDELYNIGKKLRHHKRGIHKRDDESRNNLKMIALLVELLQKEGKANYKQPLNIYRDIESLCKSKKISLDGIGKSTFFNKLKEAKNIIEFESDV